MVELGKMPATALTSNKFKFVVYNSNLTVRYINFTEVSFVDFSSNALFFLYFGEYRWVSLESCHFYLE
jgi:hypothetical protein